MLATVGVPDEHLFGADGSVPLPEHSLLPPLVYGLLCLPVLLGLVVTPADDGVLPTVLTLLLPSEGDGDDGLLPVAVSVSVPLLLIPRVEGDAVGVLPLAADPLLG